MEHTYALRGFGDFPWRLFRELLWSKTQRLTWLEFPTLAEILFP